jgi:signal transduction histidine kinase
VLAFHTDITHLKSLDNMNNDFIAVSSHELRTPITSILGSVKMIQEGILGEMPEKAKDALDIAVRNSERLALLVDDIFDLSRIETGKLDLNREIVPVSELVSQAVDLNTKFAGGFGCPILIGEIVDDVAVSADKHRILQILTNLLSNAPKFSSDDEPVAIYRKIDGEKVVISVINKGHGISKEFEIQIFKKFAQADLSDARTKKGTGLGLSISKALAELHGGSLTLDRVTDQETSFHLSLDLNRN